MIDQVPNIDRCTYHSYRCSSRTISVKQPKRNEEKIMMLSLHPRCTFMTINKVLYIIRISIIGIVWLMLLVITVRGFHSILWIMQPCKIKIVLRVVVVLLCWEFLSDKKDFQAKQEKKRKEKAQVFEIFLYFSGKP